jgi:hypothetical protein
MNQKWYLAIATALALAGCSDGHVVVSETSTKGPIQISTVEEFASIAKAPWLDYVLTDDLDFSGSQLRLDCKLTGTLDGQGHKISNLAINSFSWFAEPMESSEASHNWSALFREIGEKGKIQNLTFSSCVDRVSSSTSQDALCSGILYALNYGTISNCLFTQCSSSISGGTFSSANSGIVGGKNCDTGILTNITINKGSKIEETFSSKLPTSESIGLFTGINNGTISKVLADSTYISALTCGGITGTNFGGTISQCANLRQTITYDRSAFGSAQTLVGGLAGQNSGTIVDSYCYGLKISGTCGSEAFAVVRRVGGLVGTNQQSATLSRCYFQGSIVDAGVGGAKSVAGVCAENYDDIYSCFSDCLIHTPGAASLATGKEPGNAYRDIISFGVVFKKYSSSMASPRLVAGSVINYGGLDFANYVDTSSSSFTTTYYFSSSESKTKSWNDFLVYKEFLVSSNFLVISFYPTLPGQIGSSLDSLDYQATYVATQEHSNYDVAA